MLSRLMCWLRGHCMSWEMVPLRWSRLVQMLIDEGKPWPKKWRGECSRCGFVDYAIPKRDGGMKLDESSYPNAAKFVRDHTR